ncbi:MAG: SigE family RNA polymerase sigma factor [Geodermatophilaceae bacterium]
MEQVAQRAQIDYRQGEGCRPVDFNGYVLARLHALIRYATHLTGSHELAEDIVQDALIKAHAKWERISALDHPDLYVKRIVTNEFMNARRRKLPRTVELRSAHTEVASEGRPPGHEETTADREALLAELARLPPRQRAVLVLRFYEGLSNTEIAKVLNCRPATVRGYGSRALTALRIELDDWRAENVRPIPRSGGRS